MRCDPRIFDATDLDDAFNEAIARLKAVRMFLGSAGSDCGKLDSDQPESHGLWLMLGDAIGTLDLINNNARLVALLPRSEPAAVASVALAPS
jgi:hypothetical protein